MQNGIKSKDLIVKKKEKEKKTAIKIVHYAHTFYVQNIYS